MPAAGPAPQRPVSHRRRAVFPHKILFFPVNKSAMLAPGHGGGKRGPGSLAEGPREGGGAAGREEGPPRGGELGGRRGQTPNLPRRRRAQGPRAPPGPWVGPLCIFSQAGHSWCPQCGVSHHCRCGRGFLELADISSRLQCCFPLPSGL